MLLIKGEFLITLMHSALATFIHEDFGLVQLNQVLFQPHYSVFLFWNTNYPGANHCQQYWISSKANLVCCLHELLSVTCLLVMNGLALFFFARFPWLNSGGIRIKTLCLVDAFESRSLQNLTHAWNLSTHAHTRYGFNISLNAGCHN